MPQSSQALRAKKEARRLRHAQTQSQSSDVPQYTLVVTEGYALFEPHVREREARQVRWASKPLFTRHGKCLAVSLSKDVVFVLLEHQGHRFWRRVDSVLSPQERALWVKTGF